MARKVKSIVKESAVADKTRLELQDERGSKAAAKGVAGTGEILSMDSLRADNPPRVLESIKGWLPIVISTASVILSAAALNISSGNTKNSSGVLSLEGVEMLRQVVEQKSSSGQLDSSAIDKAANMLERAIELDAKNVVAIGGLAMVETLRGNQAEAEKLGKEAVQIAPDDHVAQVALATVLVTGDKLDEAKAQYVRLKKTRPDSLPAKLGEAVISAKMNQPEEAFKKFEAVTSADPEVEGAWLQQAQYLVQRGQIDEAINRLKNAEAHSKDPGKLHFLLGSLYYSVSKRDVALAYWRQTAAESPELLRENTIIPKGRKFDLSFDVQGNLVLSSEGLFAIKRPDELKFPVIPIPEIDLVKPAMDRWTFSDLA